MANKMIYYNDIYSDYPASVMVDKIVRLDKSVDGEQTQIHLVNGEVLFTTDSIKTLISRIESED